MHAPRSVTVGRIYVRSLAMRPNNSDINTNNTVNGAVIMTRPLREFTRGSFDECRLSVGGPLALPVNHQSKPTDLAWEYAGIGATIHIHQFLWQELIYEVIRPHRSTTLQRCSLLL